MPDQPLSYPGVGSAPFAAAMQAPMALMDMNARLVEGWVEWQRALWQPLADQLAGWIGCWPSQLDGLAGPRGAEQLG